jgi:RNA polymerase sigma factor (sigma-70 family)
LDGEHTEVPAANTAEGKLVGRIRAGDPLAEEELVVLFQRGIYAIAAARTRDREAALDITQDVLIAVLKALREGQLREPTKLAAFIQGTARNLINSYLRSRARHPEQELDPAISRINPIMELELAERQRLVRHELATFSITDQQILLLSLVDGHSLAAVAEKLNMSHEAVRARKSRAIKKITKKFADLSQKRESQPLSQ